MLLPDESPALHSIWPATWQVTRKNVVPYLDHPSSICGNNLLYQNTTLRIKMHWSKQRYGSSTVIFALFWPSTFKLWTRTLQELKRWLLEYCLKRHFLDHCFRRSCFLPTRPCAFSSIILSKNSTQRTPRLLERIIDLNKKQEIQRNWWTWRISPLVWLVFLRFFGDRFQLFLVGSHLGLSCPGHTPCYTASSSEPQ